jgi:hypothetical protein
MFIKSPYIQYAEKSQEVINVLEHEKDFTLPQEIELIKGGCIICNSDIKGNPAMGYYCDSCNLLFSEKHVK